MIILTMIGPPGCGKGTQSNLLSEMFGFKHISTGDLLRSYAKGTSELAQKITETINAGLLVDDNLMQEIIKKEIENITSNNIKAVIFDGYPRTEIQASNFDKLLESFSLKVNCAINFIADNECLVKRISGRFQCNNCGAIYNEFFKDVKNKNICDVCSSSDFSKRKDDNVEIVKNRLEKYQEKSKSILSFYKSNNKLSEVDAEQNTNNVFNQICSILNDHIDVKMLLENSKKR
jgi:adenylate kinase